MGSKRFRNRPPEALEGYQARIQARDFAREHPSQSASLLEKEVDSPQNNGAIRTFSASGASTAALYLSLAAAALGVACNGGPTPGPTPVTPCTGYTLSQFGACDANTNKQYKTVTQQPGGCSPPVQVTEPLEQACVITSASGQLVGLTTNAGFNSGTADFNGKKADLAAGSYNVSNVPVGSIDAVFTGGSFVPYTRKFTVQNGANQFPSQRAIETMVDGILFDAVFFKQYATSSIIGDVGGIANGIGNWDVSSSMPEIVILKDTFPADMYPFFYAQAKKNAEDYIPRILTGGTARKCPIVEISGGMDFPTRGKIIYRYGTKQDTGGGVASNHIRADKDNMIYAGDILVTGDAGNGTINEEFINITGVGDTATPGIPSVSNNSAHTLEISANDLMYSHVKRLLQNGAKITQITYNGSQIYALDLRHLGALDGTVTPFTANSSGFKTSIDQSIDSAMGFGPKRPGAISIEPRRFEPPPDAVRQKRDAPYRQKIPYRP